jgi:hypothetical protein
LHLSARIAGHLPGMPEVRRHPHEEALMPFIDTPPIKGTLRRLAVPLAALPLALAGVCGVAVAPGAQGGPGVSPPGAPVAAQASCSGSYSVQRYTTVVRTDLEGQQAATDLTGYQAGTCWKFRVSVWSPTGYALKGVRVGIRVWVCGHPEQTVSVAASSYTVGPFDYGDCDPQADNVRSTASTSVAVYYSVPRGAFYANIG